MDNQYNELVEEFFNDSGVQSTPIETTIPEINKNVLEPQGVRFSSAAWYNKIQKVPIMLCGIGGIGSHLSFLLSRMHPYYMYLYDADRIDHTNMSGQLFYCRDINTTKVNAARQMCQDLSNYYATSVTSANITESTSITGDIVVCGFDNMEARKALFTAWRRKCDNSIPEYANRSVFIDGRLLMEEFQILCVKGNDEYSKKLYSEKYLFDGSEAEEPLCSAKQTTHIASMIAAYMCNLITNFLTNLEAGMEVRELPFYTEYNAEIMQLITK